MTDYDKIELVQNTIKGVLNKMGIEAKVEYEETITKGLVFNVSSPDSPILIGRQGSHLHSLEVIVRALVDRKLKAPFWFSIDVDDYKSKREWFLKETAKEAAGQVKRTGVEITLEPMPSYERRLIHAYLQEHFPDVTTFSVDYEPHRRIVIKPKRNG